MIPESPSHPKYQFKYCPKCGSKDLSFKKKDVECTNCGFQYYFNAAAAVAAIITNDEGDILFTRRKFFPAKDTLDLPGGFVDPMEKAEDAIKREIKEELNLDLQEIQFISTYPNEYDFKGLKYCTLDLLFEASVHSFEHIQANDDVSEVLFIRKEDVNIDDIGLDSIKTIIRDYLKRII